MSYVSRPLPLEFWNRLHVRMEAEYQAQLRRLSETLTPTSATIDTGEMAMQRGQQSRGEAFALLDELESMQILFMLLSGQVRTRTASVGIPDLEAHLVCLRNIAQIYDTHVVGLPRRQTREHELQTALAQYAGLRTAGTGETVIAERQRLRALNINLLVMGAEDTVERVRAVRTLHASIDQKEAELQTLRATTLMALLVSDDLVEVVRNFGVDMAFVDPVPQLESGTATSSTD